jgi:hypothetical protein
MEENTWTRRRGKGEDKCPRVSQDGSGAAEVYEHHENTLVLGGASQAHSRGLRRRTNSVFKRTTDRAKRNGWTNQRRDSANLTHELQPD